jgi:hypothetical protein
MADELPGFIPHVLRLDDVSLLRADEMVLNAMVDGWRAQMLARGLAVDTIKGRCGIVSRFVEFTNEYPWRWRPLDVDQFLADLRSQQTPIALSTLRSYSNAISMFCSYVSDSRYGWVAFCEKQFGDVPSQICFEWNTPQHTTDDAVPPKRRAFTKAELQHMFDVIDDFVDDAHRTGFKALADGSARFDRVQDRLCIRTSAPRAGDAGPDRLWAQSAHPGLRRLRRIDGALGQRDQRFGPAPANSADIARIRLGRRASAVLVRRRPSAIQHCRALPRVVAQRARRKIDD